ncbi:MAG: Ig domain-containing protein [Verrucomicrobiota bacterium]|nr:Ig domain-containing protein [Limisphaera sp.]MDW8381397.1 Ig domain-containing protein [Verrucomicrobiota bacterium]
MWHRTKACCGLLLLLAVGANMYAFSLLGPVNEAYQVPAIGYNLPSVADIGAPKNLGEEYRWNLPVVYYAYDASFLDYFGSNGVAALEQAIAHFNGLRNVSSYSPDLTEFPLEVVRYNYRAQALGLLDLKSIAMHLILEELGLAEPVRWTWCLRDRYPIPGLSCPNMIYHVIRRNFDPVTFEPTAYVNGVLYSYQIVEICSGPDPLADAYEYQVDPLAQSSYPVAETAWFNYGAYLTGLSRDDVGGLRYLWRSNNVNWEAITSDSLLFYTNYQTTQLLISSNLNTLVAAAWTNDALALQTLYPGLVIAQTDPVYTTEITTNIVAYFTNAPWAPAPWQGLVWATNYVTNYVIRYRHTFANVVTNRYFPYTLATLVTTNVGPCQNTWGFPAGICTNVTTNHVVLNIPSGDFFILPTNALCGYVLLSNLPPILTVVTNPVAVATNQLGQQFSQNVYTYFTNHAVVIHPVSCETNVPMNRQGIERMQFVRAQYDSLLGRFFQPITNYYTLNAVTNNRVIRQHLQRVVVAPDFLFTATDLNLLAAVRTETAATFIMTNAIPGLAGPGHIEPDIQIGFNRVGPMNINVYDPFLPFSGLSEWNSTTNFIWASFDGSTNAPVVYPQGASLRDLEDMLFSALNVQPLALPYGVVGQYFQVIFTVEGGQPPYVFSLAEGSPGLPLGLELSPGGALLGTPRVAGIYDFVLQIQDAQGRRRLQSYTLTIRL